VNRTRHYVPKGIVDSPIKLLLSDIFQNEKLSNKKADDFSGWLLYIMPVLFAGVFGLPCGNFYDK
jgi:hypothetical protein